MHQEECLVERVIPKVVEGTFFVGSTLIRPEQSREMKMHVCYVVVDYTTPVKVCLLGRLPPPHTFSKVGELRISIGRSMKHFKRQMQ